MDHGSSCLTWNSEENPEKSRMDFFKERSETEISRFSLTFKTPPKYTHKQPQNSESNTAADFQTISKMVGNIPRVPSDDS
jgi:hypothetical protein